MGEPSKPAQAGGENVIFIGKKETIGYVLAVVTQFSKGAGEVRIKARGRQISRAVDVAEIVRNKYLAGVKVRGVNISTDELAGEGGAKVSVSSIEIVLAK